jgi:hypothetical protein
VARASSSDNSKSESQSDPTRSATAQESVRDYENAGSTSLAVDDVRGAQKKYPTSNIIFGSEKDNAVQQLYLRVAALERVAEMAAGVMEYSTYAAPQAPEIISNSNPDSKTFRCVFKPSSDKRVKSYNVYRSDQAVNGWIANRIDCIPQPNNTNEYLTYQDSIEDAQNWYYYFSSVSETGQESPRVLARRNSGDGSAPGAVQNFVVTGSNGSFKATWAAPLTNILTLDDFAIQYDNNSDFSSPVATVRLGLVYATEGVDPAKTYYWRIAAHNQTHDTTTNPDANLTAILPYGWGPWTVYLTGGGLPWGVNSGSVISSGLLDTDIPGKLENLDVKVTIQGTFSAEWDKPFLRGTSTPCSFVIDIAEDYSLSKAPWATVDGILRWGETYYIEGVRPGVGYYFRFAARNNSGVASDASGPGATLGQDGWGPWTYHDGAGGSITMSDAVKVDSTELEFKTGSGNPRVVLNSANGLVGYSSGGVITTQVGTDGSLYGAQLKMPSSVSGTLVISGRTDAQNNIIIYTDDGTELNYRTGISMIHDDAHTNSGYISFLLDDTQISQISKYGINCIQNATSSIGSVPVVKAMNSSGGTYWAALTYAGIQTKGVDFQVYYNESPTECFRCNDTRTSVKQGVFNITNSATPASKTASGTAGDICWDSGFLYVCYATNQWKRVAISDSGW